MLKLELELVQIKPKKSKGPEKWGETFSSRVWDMGTGMTLSIGNRNVWERNYLFLLHFNSLEGKIGLNLKIELFIIIDHIGRVKSQEVPR